MGGGAIKEEEIEWERELLDDSNQVWQEVMNPWLVRKHMKVVQREFNFPLDGMPTMRQAAYDFHMIQRVKLFLWQDIKDHTMVLITDGRWWNATCSKEGLEMYLACDGSNVIDQSGPSAEHCLQFRLMLMLKNTKGELYHYGAYEKEEKNEV